MSRFTFAAAILGLTAALSTTTFAAPTAFQIQPYPLPRITNPQPRLQPRLVPPIQQLHFHQPVTLGFYGDFHDGHGMHVTGVVRGSLAQRPGLEPGDVILRVNNRSLTCEHDLQDALQGTDRVRLLVQDVRSGRPRWTQTVWLNQFGHDHGHGHLYSQQVPQIRAY